MKLQCKDVVFIWSLSLRHDPDHRRHLYFGKDRERVLRLRIAIG